MTSGPSQAQGRGDCRGNRAQAVGGLTPACSVADQLGDPGSSPVLSGPLCLSRKCSG